MFCATCPICGHKILKGENGTAVEALCPKCNRLIRIEVNDIKVTSYVSETQLQRQKELAPTRALFQCFKEITGSSPAEYRKKASDRSSDAFLHCSGCFHAVFHLIVSILMLRPVSEIFLIFVLFQKKQSITLLMQKNSGRF